MKTAGVDEPVEQGFDDDGLGTPGYRSAGARSPGEGRAGPPRPVTVRVHHQSPATAEADGLGDGSKRPSLRICKTSRA